MGKASGSRGAKRGANRDRYQAMPSHVQRLSVQLNSTSGTIQRRQATCQKCLLSSRPQVRILLGAQPNWHFSLLCSRAGSQPGSQSLRTAANKGGQNNLITASAALRPPLIATSSLTAIGAMPTSSRLSIALACPGALPG